MKTKILALLFCLISTSAAADDWGRKDTYFLGGALGLLAVDWAQTHDLARRNETFYATPACQDPETRSLAILYNGSCPTTSTHPYREVNPLLPKNPSTGDVDKYFAVALIGTAGLAYVLPATYRRVFLGSVIVLESIVVLHNRSIGLRLSF